MAGNRWHRWRDNGLELRVQAKPRSSREGLGEIREDAVVVRVNAPPVEGKANKRLLAVLSEAFDVPPSRVSLLRGERSRIKWVRIEQPGHIPGPLKTALRQA